MEKIIEEIEGVLKSIREVEMKNNSKARALALEINAMIFELRLKSYQKSDQGLIKYMNPKMLLEN